MDVNFLIFIVYFLINVGESNKLEIRLGYIYIITIYYYMVFNMKMTVHSEIKVYKNTLIIYLMIMTDVMYTINN